ncbi:MAG: hypothetical protein LUG60_01040 [Erysipelotrichaceae bacterium]|nr:hypothetical protein [Erysipelotrichaceae bacterium]
MERRHTKKYLLLIILVFIIFTIPIKGTLSLETSLSNTTVNTFEFTSVADATDNTSNNDKQDITDASNVNTNTKTGDDTMLNIVLIGMLVSIGGLAICWTKENKEIDKKNN